MRQKSTHLLPRLLTAVAPIALVLLLSSGNALAQDEPNLDQRIDTARSTLTEMKQRFGGATDKAYELEIRLQEGQVLLELGDPERASVLFLDIVERDGWRGQPGYKQARFLLGRSLYESGLNNSAREQLEQVVDTGRPEDYEPALTLLIEIAIATDDWAALNELYQEIDRRSGGRAMPELNYARGKALYAEERYEEARDVLSRIDMSTFTGLKGRYFAGVARVKLGELEDAMTDFVAVTEASPTVDDPRARELRELAFMGIARLHYEKEEWPEALDAYQEVARNSPHFDQALYEITWVWVRQDEPRTALKFIDLLELLRPDSIFLPEAQRLKGDLQKEVGEFEDALATYENLLTEFEPTLRELDAMVEGEEDRLGYFKELVAEDTLGRANYLPEDAAKYVENDGRMNEAAEMVGALGKANGNIEESKALIAEIEAAIDGANRYEFFKETRGAWAAASAFENTLLSLHRDINNREAELLGGDAGGAARTERKSEEARYEELPQTREDYMEREQAYKMAVEDRKLRAHRLRINIQGSQAQVDAIERWMLVEGSRSGLTDAEEASIRDSIREVRGDINSMNRELDSIERELRVMSSLGSGDSSLLTEEAEVREAYKMALLRESEALKTARAGTSSGELGRLDQYRTDVRALEGELENFRAQVVAVVDSRVAEIKSRLEVESKLVSEYETRYSERRNEVRDAAGEIAYHHWQRVRKMFADLVLSADVGVVDVAWLKKEALSDDLDGYIELRNQEREILEQEFKQVLRELGQEEGTP